MRPIYQIWIEEQLIDIDPKTVIALTLQMSDFGSGDIISRKASFTNQIKVPATPTNIRIFEFANNPKSGSTFPYFKKSIVILSNGIRILEGVVIIKLFDNYFNLQIYSNPKDLSFRIANLYLSDLDFGDSPITWNAAFIDSKRASTSGWCAPVVNYGQIDTTVGGNLSIGAYYLPAVSYKDTLTAILTNAGYTVSGIFYTSDTLFNSMVILYGRNSFPSTTLKLNEALSTTLLQSDFIRDFLVKFGAFFKIVNNNIEIVTFEGILNDVANSVDWTNKRVKNRKDILQYTWGGLAMQNNFLYQHPDNIPDGYSYLDNAPVDSTDGYLTIDNESLDQSTDIYTSLFDRPDWIKLGLAGTTPALEVVNGTGANFVYCATSSIWDTLPASFNFQNTPKNILAFLDTKDASEVSVVYNGSVRADYKVARFNPNPNLTAQAQSLAWRQTIAAPHRSTSQGLLDIYYASIQRIFTDGIKTTTHEYNLTDMDINSLDLLTLVFDDGNYYLINKANNFISNKTTRVELLQNS